MTVDKLKEALDKALQNYCKNAEETRLQVYGNDELHEVISSVQEDVFKCFNEFEEKIIEFEKNRE